MGLASALSTALTGLTGSETTIDVVGNNLANSNTVGFKSSTATFATQFLQTYSLGSGPSANYGGTNPRQIGLGTMVSSIETNFSEGTISNTSLSSDMAIQGNGFFIIRAMDGSNAYTRDGEFVLNSQNQLVTPGGNMVLGYTVDNNFNIQKAALSPLTIPFGMKMVAQATQSVTLSGTLPPTGDIADTAGVIDTETLGDDTKTHPGATTAAATNAAGVGTVSASDGGTGTGSIQAGSYSYKLVYSKVDGSDPYSESVPSASGVAATVAADTSSLVIHNLFSIKSAATTAGYQYINIYRAPVVGGTAGTYAYIDSVDTNNIADASYTFTDTAAAGGSDLDSDMLSGTYGYYISFFNSTNSRTSNPVAITDSSGSTSISATDQRIEITLPPAETTSGDWDSWAIYRNVPSIDKNTFHLVNTVNFGGGVTSYIDSSSDDSIKGNGTLSMIGTGSEISDTTLLTDVIKYDSATSSYKHVFTAGALNISDKKGTEDLSNTFNIAAGSTVGDLLTFLTQSLGIQSGGGIPVSKNVADPSSPYTPGAQLIDGKITVVGNNGVDNDISISGLTSGTAKNTVNLPFSPVQSGVGQSAATGFIAYDSLGMPCKVNLTAVLESTDSMTTTYRWFADSTDNQTTGSAQVAVGTGLIKFDGSGNLISVIPDTISINRDNVASVKPLKFNLDLNNVSGLAANISLQYKTQDGSPPGTLSSYAINSNGLITGVFSNSARRDLGQIMLANFANPNGLVQLGGNLYAPGMNSGNPIIGGPGENGIGSVVSGAIELSNADVGGNLIDLILASTMYRSNTKVITTVQTMLDTLLQLGR